MSGESKTLTLEEALAELGRKDYALKMDPDAPGRPDPETGEYLPRWGVLNADGLVRSFGDTWPEAVSKALGAPVVARDEAAELRAALDATVDAINGVLIYHGYVISTSARRELSGASNEADALLRRLAGGGES